MEGNTRVTEDSNQELFQFTRAALASLIVASFGLEIIGQKLLFLGYCITLLFIVVCMSGIKIFAPESIYECYFTGGILYTSLKNKRTIDFGKRRKT